MRISFFFGLRFFLTVLALAATTALAATNASAPRPHVVFILADDLGWGDVGFHGGEIKTPQIDRLAAAGARLDQFYVQPVCSPTRAAFMTGRYPIRHGLHVGVVRPWARYGLPLEERTLPQALKEAGYVTAITGKWHLGHFEPAYLPTRRGFDHQYGHYNGALDYNTHERDGGFDWHRDDKVAREEGYATDLIANEAARLIGGHDAAKPLFLYVPFNAVHSPFQVPERYLAPYGNLKGNRRLYAGMLAAMDEGIGRIVDALEKKGLRENTLIVFCSDNGGPAPGVVTSNGPLRSGKGTVYEGGVRVPAVAVWPGKIKPGAIVSAPLHIVDWYPTLLRLAGVSSPQKLPLDGRDAWAAITQGAASPHEDILLNITPLGGAVRAGDWKLVVGGQYSDVDGGPGEGNGKAGKKAGKKSGQGADGANVELFNLKLDPYEKTNLAGSEPARVKELRARLDGYARAAVPSKQAPRADDFKVPAVWGERE
ncbi:arylsulfatase B [Horticoccus sp. 23ND18S-11]|uniref:arylsulfatase B n=1 Tax=Horticoccus sp. 23ND18S-11 TaxID=3391832 RepID=UPI0039C9901C